MSETSNGFKREKHSCFLYTQDTKRRVIAVPLVFSWSLYMEQKRLAIPLPHEEREWMASTLTPAFDAHMRMHGFTTLRMRNVYTDPDVFRQQWVVCPNGVSYPGHIFYHLFDTISFRKLLRYLLSRTPCTREPLEQLVPHDSLLTSYLSFLLDQEWFHRDGRWYEQGPYQGHISNIGRTLEWYVAEWFRLTYSINTVVPVRHGVEVARLPLAGDLDVVAFLDDLVILVECKSYSEVEQAHFSRFLQRVHAFRPTLAIMLIDTPSPFAHERLALFNAALQPLSYAPLRGSRGFYWGALNSYVVNVEHSIETSLFDVLRFHQWRARSV